MKLLTNELEKEFEKTGSQDGKGDEAKIIAKFFDPTGSWTWFATEIEEYRFERDGEHLAVATYKEKREMEKDGWKLYDVIFFGLVHGHEKELGSFSLKELEDLRLPMGLGIERDLHFEDKKIKDLK